MARARTPVVLALTLLFVLAGVPPGVQAGPPVYVALGDSFTAGPMIPNQRLGPLGCFRSDHNYPHLVARVLGVALRDVSCSGAATPHMAVPQAVFDGANPPQLQAVRADARWVTVSIGGNDIGYSEIAQTCPSLLPAGAPCQRRYVGRAGDELSRRIAETGPRVAAVLAQVRRRAPLAKVVVVGYPAVLPDAGDGCWPVMPYAGGDVAYLRAKEMELNAMLAARAAAAKAAFVDAYRPSIGHDACASPGARWVEPVVPLSAAAPVHPNAAGMERVAALVAAALRASR